MSDERPHTEAELVERLRAIDERAPERLHARVRTMVAEHDADTPRRRGARLRPSMPVLAGSLAASVAVVVVLVIALGGGSSAPDDVHAASQLALSGATLPAPLESAQDRSELAAQVDGVAFPYWEDSFGWRASGARAGTIGGRPVQTVYYTDAAGGRIGYAIVGGTPPLEVSGGTEVWRGGTPYRLISSGDVRAVAWLRSGRLCVIAGRGVDAATLLELASWHEGPVSA